MEIGRCCAIVKFFFSHVNTLFAQMYIRTNVFADLQMFIRTQICVSYDVLTFRYVKIFRWHNKAFCYLFLRLCTTIIICLQTFFSSRLVFFRRNCDKKTENIIKLLVSLMDNFGLSEEKSFKRFLYRWNAQFY